MYNGEKKKDDRAIMKPITARLRGEVEGIMGGGLFSCGGSGRRPIDIR